jgi:hypothetical protein
VADLVFPLLSFHHPGEGLVFLFASTWFALLIQEVSFPVRRL